MTLTIGPCFDPAAAEHAPPADEAELDSIALHLLAGCPTCTDRTRSWWQGEGGSALLERARETLAGTNRRLHAERREAAEWLDRLREMPHGRQFTVLASARRACVPAMVDYLIRESKARLSSEIGEAVRFAELAVEVARRIDRDEHGGDALAADYEARGLVALARAHRRASDLRGAGNVLPRVSEALDRGTGDPLEMGSYLEEKAELRIAQRRFEDAFVLLQRAIGMYHRMGETHAAGRAMLRLATAHGQGSDPEASIAVLREAAAHLDSFAEPRAILALVHNLAWHCADAGHLEQALAYLRDAELTYQQFARPADLVRIRWTRAKILIERDRFEAAADLFMVCQEEFARLELPYEAASVSLELAIAYARLGRVTEIRRLVIRLLRIFEVLEVDRESTAALLCLREAAEAGAVTADLIASVASVVARRSRERS